jgi:hypothetical protein
VEHAGDASQAWAKYLVAVEKSSAICQSSASESSGSFARLSKNFNRLIALKNSADKKMNKQQPLRSHPSESNSWMAYDNEACTLLFRSPGDGHDNDRRSRPNSGAPS